MTHRTHLTRRTFSHRRPGTVAVAALAALSATAVLATAPADAATTAHNEQVVLHNVTGAQADAKSAISGTGQVASYDGRFVVFSTAARLVRQDRNQLDDVYLRDTVDGITILVSQRNGRPGNDYSIEPTISNDGRYVAFTTFATNLFADKNGSVLDVAVKDMATGRTRLVSVGNDGRQRRQNSFSPVISGNGRRVAFQTFAAFGRKDGDRREDVYLRDVRHHWTRQVSLTPRGTDVRPSVLVGDVSDNGRLVTFGEANDLWVRDADAGSTTRFWHEPDSPPCQGFPAGSAGRPVISGNGRFVAFSSCATKIPGADGQHAQVYRMDLATRALRLVTTDGTAAGTADSFLPSLSRSGRYVGFGSDASNLAGTDSGTNTDAFVADLADGSIRRASQDPAGAEGNSWSASTGAAISGDGHTLVYESYATNLVAHDAYDWEEVLAWRG
jgi:Tol biopolymer transport system component